MHNDERERKPTETKREQVTELRRGSENKRAGQGKSLGWHIRKILFGTKKSKKPQTEKPAEAAKTGEAGAAVLGTDAKATGAASSTKGAAPKKKLNIKSAAVTLILRIVFLGVVATVVFVFVLGVYICHNNDMYPAVRDGDLCITLKITEYHNGDIIAYEHDGYTFFGRVTGEPGDIIDIRDGNVYINGMLQAETIYYQTFDRGTSGLEFPYQIQEGEIFVLADMREVGMDSRDFGLIVKPKGKLVLLLRRRTF